MLFFFLLVYIVKLGVSEVLCTHSKHSNDGLYFHDVAENPTDDVNFYGIIAKYDPHGQVIWYKRFTEIFFRGCTFHKDEFYAVGVGQTLPGALLMMINKDDGTIGMKRFFKLSDLGTQSGEAQSIISDGTSMIIVGSMDTSNSAAFDYRGGLLLRVDEIGSIISSKAYGENTRSYYFHDIAILQSGDLVVVGWLLGGEENLIFGRFTADFSLVYMFRVEGQSIGEGIHVNEDNSFVVTGTDKVGDSGIVMKIDSNDGSSIWSKRVYAGSDSSSYSEIFRSSTETWDGHVLAVGFDDDEFVMFFKLSGSTGSILNAHGVNGGGGIWHLGADKIRRSLTGKGHLFAGRVQITFGQGYPTTDWGPILGRLDDNGEHCLTDPVGPCGSVNLPLGVSPFLDIVDTTAIVLADLGGSIPVGDEDYPSLTHYIYCRGCGDLPYYSPLVCNGNGTCDNNDFICSCIGDYYGEHCEYWDCAGLRWDNVDNVCSGHGRCILSEYCDCDADYYPDGYNENCQNWNCHGIRNDLPLLVCSGNGICISADNCTCSKGYSGRECDYYECDGKAHNDSSVCSGHGDCSIPDNCDCYDGYYPGNGDGNWCPDWDCFTNKYDEDSVCNYQNGTCSSPDNCTDCQNGYMGTECDDYGCNYILHDSPLVCYGHGTCVSPNVCECDINYSSSMKGVHVYCDVFECYGILNNLTSEVCSFGNGTCISYDNCSCNSGYYGDECDSWDCFGTSFKKGEVCSERGICVKPDHCECHTDYFGDICNVTTCYEVFNNDTRNSDLLCYGHGNCYEKDVCQCFWNSSHYGQFCNISDCYGTLSNESGVCSDHGSCLGHDDCECYGLYNGSDICDVHFCYGVRSNEPDNVCSGHGDCITPDECICYDGEEYDGDWCQFWSCINISALNTEEVCGGGNGHCVAHDNCLCKAGYSSSTPTSPCDEWYCGEYFKTDDGVCNERGECVSSHLCECGGGYEGSICDTWSCGFEYNFPQACSGHGECLAPEDCDCDSGYVGGNCQTNILYATVMAPILTLAGGVALVLVGTVICVILCCFCCCVCLFLFVLCVISVSTCNLRFRMNKFQKLKNVDILLKEQEMEEDESVAHIRIDRSLFEIPMKELKLERILGEGGSSSIVYLAIWKSQEVAFKCFKTRVVCSSQDSFDEFEREISVLGSVNHPHVISCYGCSLEPPRVGIVMEFCSKGDMKFFLHDYKKRHGKMYPLDGKTRLGLETSLACDYLHSRNIIHRDLKLDNVLLDTHEVCKLMDFGLSRIIDRMSRQKTVKIGTSVFMAPEIVLSGKYDTKVDVFSFGMMIYIVFTENYYPFGTEAEKVGSIEMKIATNPHYRPHMGDITKLGEEWKWLEDVISRCWDHHPTNRPTFSELSGVFQTNLKVLRKEEDEENTSADDDGESRRFSSLTTSSSGKDAGITKYGGIDDNVPLLRQSSSKRRRPRKVRIRDELAESQKLMESLEKTMVKEERESERRIRELKRFSERNILQKDAEIRKLEERLRRGKEKKDGNEKRRNIQNTGRRRIMKRKIPPPKPPPKRKAPPKPPRRQDY